MSYGSQRVSSLLAGLGMAVSIPLSAQSVELDSWSQRGNWRMPDGSYGVAAHATLMPDGRVVFIGYRRDTEDPLAATEVGKASFTMTPSPAFAPVPDAHVVDPLDDPVEIEDLIVGTTYITDDMFCTGHSLTSDGELFTAGGTRFFSDLVSEEFLSIGLPFATLYDGTSWTRVAEHMAVTSAADAPSRWYPAVTRLHDGRMLVTGGYDFVQPVGNANLSAEVFDPVTGTWEIVSDYGEAPIQIFNGDYTHPVVLPGRLPRLNGQNDVLMLGMFGYPVFLSLDSPFPWSISQQARPGTLPLTTPNAGASSLPLPLRLRDGEWGYRNGSMLVAGGAHDSVHQGRVDVYDPVEDAWSASVDMGVDRHHPTSVLLPDGRVAVIAGHNHDGDPDLRRVSYVDPAEGFAVSLGLSFEEEVRGYHNVALLLPDGRVFVGGGQDLETGEVPEKSSFRYLYPSYMFAERPVIQFAPPEIRYGKRFLLFADAEPVEVVLMALGSMTHSYDFNQRYVQLKRSKVDVPAPSTSTHLFFEAPSSARLAPPGHYMLFVVDEDRIPSEAVIVRLR